MILKIGVAASLVLAMGTGCGSDDKREQFFIGAAMDLTGFQPTFSWIASLDLAQDEADAALKASNEWSDYSFRIDRENTGLDPAVGKQRMLEFRDAGAKAAIVQMAPVAFPIMQMYYDEDTTNDPGMPVNCPNCVPPQFNNLNFNPPNQVAADAAHDDDEWFFRTVQNNLADTFVYAQLMKDSGLDRNGDGLLKVSIYSPAVGAVQSFRNAVATAVTELGAAEGLEVSVEFTVQFPFSADINTYDFDADMARLVDDVNETGDEPVTDGFPDFLVELSAAGIAAGTLIAFKKRDDVDDVLFIHSINFRNENIIPTLGSVAEGEIGVSSVVLALDGTGQKLTKSAETFKQALIDAVGIEPQIESATYYDAANLFFLATIHAAHTAGVSPIVVSPDKVRASMYKLNETEGTKIGVGTAELTKAINLISDGQPINYEGASGNCDFTVKGEVKQMITRFIVKDQKYVDLEIFDCTTDETCPSIWVRP